MQEVIPLVFLMIFLFFIVALVITVATGNLAVPLVMGVLFVLVLLIVGEVQKTSSKTNRRRRNSGRGIQPQEAICCPNCGSPVSLRGDRWECGYCGDFGGISSLHPSEKAKLREADTPSIQLTFTAADTSEEPEENAPPRSFSRTELEDMVRRWDFSENEQACRDLLIAAFPDAVRFWNAEEMSEMDTMELLGKVGAKNPETGIQMMKFLLDTAENHLQEPEAAQQLLGNDLYELCHDQAVQPQLLTQLKTDEHLAQQLFRSAYVSDIQGELLDACDWFEERSLKEYLLSLLTQNSYFKGFN